MFSFESFPQTLAGIYKISIFELRGAPPPRAEEAQSKQDSKMQNL